MSRTRRNFSAKLKSDLVLELLKGENISILSHPKTKYNLPFSVIGKKNLSRNPVLFLMIPVRKI